MKPLMLMSPGLPLARVVMAAAREARSAGHVLVPAGHLGAVAIAELRTGNLHEPALRAAAATELQLRYGVVVTALDILAATRRAVAVAFRAATLAGPTDPVDVLTLWRGADLPTSPLCDIVSAMLRLDDDAPSAAWYLLRAMREYAARLSAWPWPNLAERILFEQVLAADITLLLRRVGVHESTL